MTCTEPKYTAELLATMTRIASVLSKRYARRCRGRSRDDMEQEAWVAMLEAMRTYDDSRGDPGGYLWITALNAIARSVVAGASPVTTKGKIGKLVGLTGTSIDTPKTEDKQSGAELFPELQEHAATPEKLVAQKEQEETVARIAVELLGEGGYAFLRSLVAGDWTAADIASAHNVSVRHVYGKTNQAMVRLRSDENLYKLWKVTK